MKTEELERALVEHERRYWQAIKDKDLDAAMRLTDFPCIIAGPHGVARIDRETFADIMSHAPYTLRAFELHDAQVRMLSDDVAVLAYEIHEEMIVDGQSKTIDAADSSTWIRRDGQWRCAQHSEAITQR